MRRRRSLDGTLVLVMALVALIAAVVAGIASIWLRPIATAACALLAGVLCAALFAPRTARRWRETARALADGIESLRDRDFSVSIKRTSDDELGDLVDAYNSLGALLRRERLEIYQRELLLDTVIQTTPLSLVLTNAGGTILYSNVAARELLGVAGKLEGHLLDQLLLRVPPALREALRGEGDRLFTVEIGGEPQVFHLSKRRFRLNAQYHELLLLKHLTRELSAQEVAIWKRVIRVIAHELNNSLAPISSLAHSGRMLVEGGDTQQLTRVFRTIEERAKHLAGFIDGYSRFAKLPKPRPAALGWRELLARLQDVAPYRLQGSVPDGPVWADGTQLEQVAINLLKNARESGSPPGDIEVRIEERRGGHAFEVYDRGSGLAPDALASALLPFFSTKSSGTGLGLTICREIIEAHDGYLTLSNREGGGAVASVWLPAAPRSETE